ncbi:hypothetical protein ACFS5M_12535 [Lacinutrix iliipiscaria]|uniref:Uncharacterized protein n=1 Tax=Lacinutrix iliipiscaria TaxID=1230532 RepID=A0ABW5WT89_9FLAO
MTSITTTKGEQVILDVNVKLRKANSKDFNEIVYKTEKGIGVKQIIQPKIGQPYWLKSLKTGKIDNRNYRITEDTGWPEFKQYLRLEMVYVPAGYFELKDADL